MQGHILEIACIVGLVLIVVGFVLVLSRLRKLEIAAERARAAAERVQEQFLQMNALAGLGGAIGTLDDMKRMHAPMLPDKYASLKQELIAVRSRIPNLTDQQRSTIQGAIQQITNIEEQVGTAAANGGAPALHRINPVITRQVDQLSEILADLKSQIDRPGR